MPEFDFDLFLSHNSKDKPAVVQLRGLLKLRGLKGWLDKEQLPPGHNWIPLLKTGLDNSRAIAVCVGGHGVGPWQDQEVQEALRLAVRDPRPVIPVYLPSAKDVEVSFPDFVELRTHVDFRDGFTQAALDDLVFGITGSRPKHGEPERRLARLPQQFHFFGREKELATIRDALDPARRTWGVLIDGTGGIGKTALAIRAAYTAPEEWFQRICFVSAKTHELTPQGKQARSQFATPTWRDMLTDLAGEMGLREVAQRTLDDKLAALLERTLREQPTLIVFDNLESLPEDDLHRLYEFLGVLPMGCKAIVTSRRRSDLDVRTIRLERLEQSAALEIIASLAEDRPALRRATEAERLSLYEETGGNPLLIRWIAGQLGRGKCHDIAAALELLKKAPSGGEDNDPLQFIMGDLVEEFTDSETKAITALTHFTKPIEVRHIAELAGLSHMATQTTLEDLSFRALVNPDLEYQRFILAPLVGDYLRRVKPELVNASALRLTGRVYEMIREKGYAKHENFTALEHEWDLIESSLPLFLTEDNQRLQTVCDALRVFLEYNGHWEERLILSLKAEDTALQAGDYIHAGWRAYDAAWVCRLLGDAAGVLKYAERSLLYFTQGQNAGPNELRGQGNAIRLKGTAHMMMGDHAEAEKIFEDALSFRRVNHGESADLAVVLNDLAIVRHLRGDMPGARLAAEEAIRCSLASGRTESLATSTGTLAEITLGERDLAEAERLAIDALNLGSQVGRKQLIAANHRRLAGIYYYQRKFGLAISHARQSLAIYRDDLRDSPDYKTPENVLKEAQLELSLSKHLGWTFNSNALEGNTLTLEEVKLVLADPQANIAGKRREELNETRNHAEALRQMAEIIRAGREFTVDDLFSLHTTLMQGTAVDIYKPVGKWKVETNEAVVKLDGKRTINSNYGRPEDVARLMKTWLEELNRRMSSRSTPLEDYIWLHATFARIHPFADGNGRLARLLANVPVYAKAHDPIIISATTRDRYLESLARWQIACGPPSPTRSLLDKPDLLSDFRLLCEKAASDVSFE